MICVIIDKSWWSQEDVIIATTDWFLTISHQHFLVWCWMSDHLVLYHVQSWIIIHDINQIQTNCRANDNEILQSRTIGKEFCPLLNTHTYVSVPWLSEQQGNAISQISICRSPVSSFLYVVVRIVMTSFNPILAGRGHWMAPPATLRLHCVEMMHPTIPILS